MKALEIGVGGRDGDALSADGVRSAGGRDSGELVGEQETEDRNQQGPASLGAGEGKML